MIDLHDLRERPDIYQKACNDKLLKFSVQEFLKLDEQYRTLKNRVEAMRADQNSFNKELPKLAGDEKTKKLASMKELSASLKLLEDELRQAEEKWQREQLGIPSIPHPDSPIGKDDTENAEMKKWGTIPNFGFKPLDHVELGQKHDLLDVERGVKIAGARNYFLKGDGARLQHAVMSLAMDLLYRRGYTLMEPPHVVKWKVMMGTGYFPGGEEQAYHLDERDPEYHLIGTAEVPVTAYHLDELLPISELPKRYGGYSPCYRREAGTYGKDTHGIYRIHQFYKVEQVIIHRASKEESAAMHAELLANSEEMLQLLELPYRVVVSCTGELGRGQVYKNDIEAWMPSRKGWGETHSCSTFYDFQARRLNLRYKDGDGKNHYCHTLNNTLIASPRILIPLLEIHQQADGSIVIPKALRPFMGGQEKIG